MVFGLLLPHSLRTSVCIHRKYRLHFRYSADKHSFFTSFSFLGLHILYIYYSICSDVFFPSFVFIHTDARFCFSCFSEAFLWLTRVNQIHQNRLHHSVSRCVCVDFICTPLIHSRYFKQIAMLCFPYNMFGGFGLKHTDPFWFISISFIRSADTN